LASIYLSIEGGVLTAVTTDSFRLVEKKIPLTHKGTQGSFLIPAKNALEVSQALSDEETIVSFDDHQCAFVTPDIMIVSRLTNAVYPDYHQIIPKESVVEAILPRKTFEQALKRTTIFSDTFQKVRLQFDVQKQTCTFFARNTDIGESSDGVQGKITGSTLEISFNHRYLSTILSLTSTDQISFTAAGIGRPLLCRGVGDTSLLYLVSPMNQ
jgi:DNA polymerase-3 subunit beta